MSHDRSPRFTWRRHPRHLPRPQEPLPPMVRPFTYNAYGQDAEPLTEADAGDENASGPLFQGMRYDPKDAALFQHHRAFSPKLAKWVGSDLGYVDGLNWYNAPVDEPVNPINPLGT